jgi:uncharacterized membrane protein YfhO
MAANATDALATLQNPGFDPTKQAVIQDLGQTKLPTILPATGAESVEIVQRSNNRLHVAIQASTPALLVFSEIWYPGWRATVNEQPVTILQTNVALRAIPVPAGTSTVALVFQPDSWRAGLLSAIAGWVLLLIVFFFEKTRG